MIVQSTFKIIKDYRYMIGLLYIKYRNEKEGKRGLLFLADVITVRTFWFGFAILSVINEYKKI